jgi:hypothetical protein
MVSAAEPPLSVSLPLPPVAVRTAVAPVLLLVVRMNAPVASEASIVMSSAPLASVVIVTVSLLVDVIVASSPTVNVVIVSLPLPLVVRNTSSVAVTAVNVLVSPAENAIVTSSPVIVPPSTSPEPLRFSVSAPCVLSTLPSVMVDPEPETAVTVTSFSVVEFVVSAVIAPMVMSAEFEAVRFTF